MTTDDDSRPYEHLLIGAHLKHLRGRLSLREVQRQTGVSNLHLSRIEKGEQLPGLNVLRRLAAFYNVDLRFLVRRAGLLASCSGPLAGPSATAPPPINPGGAC